MRPPTSLLITAIAAAGLAACHRPSGSGEGAGGIVVEWTGSDTGRIAAPARAEWCDSLRLLEIRAVRGDSGVALAIYPVSTARPDSYPVRPPQDADSLPPASAVALRWFAETSIKGFQSDSGLLVLEGDGGRVSGQVTAAMRSINDEMRLDLRAAFNDLRVVPAARGCVARPPDTGVD